MLKRVVFALLNSTPVQVPFLSCIPSAYPVRFVSPSDATSLAASRRSLFVRLQRLSKLKGRIYVTKLMLPWILTKYTHAVVLDMDLWVQSPTVFEMLVEEFDFFTPTQLIGTARDVVSDALFRKDKDHLHWPANGGVQLLRLEAMRNGTYEALLRAQFQPVGMLGDQVFFYKMSVTRPELFYRLSCKFNRQANDFFRVHPSNYECDDCLLFHGNLKKYKDVVEEAWRINSTMPIERAIKPNIRAYFSACFAPRAHACPN